MIGATTDAAACAVVTIALAFRPTRQLAALVALTVALTIAAARPGSTGGPL